MQTVMFIICAAAAFVGIIFFSLREFHMLQLNGYKTPEHSRWMKKNYKRYILPLILFVLQFTMLAT